MCEECQEKSNITVMITDPKLLNGADLIKLNSSTLLKKLFFHNIFVDANLNIGEIPFSS